MADREETEEVWHPDAALQTDSAHRKLWLIKVPNFVAKRWKACCEQSAERGEHVGRPLATLRLVQVEEASGAQAADGETTAPRTQYQLKLDASIGAGIPQDFVLKNTTKFADPMLAFSDKGEQMAAEGSVRQKFDCEVMRRGGGTGGKMVLDQEYCKLSRQRHLEAATKTRTVLQLTDAKLVGAPTTVQIGQKRKEVSEKRERMDAQALTPMLFKLFERQPRWSFAQLQKDTQQPTQHLKEVLSEIAVKNPRGPYKDLWELKKEYTAGGAEDAPTEQQ